MEKNWREKLGELSFMKGYYFKLEDNGLVEKKDDQLVFNRKDLEDFISSEIEKERKKLVSDINNTLKESIENNESVSKVIEKIDIKVFDVDESSTIRVDMVNMVDKEIEKAREEGRREYFSMGMEYFSLIEDSNIYQQKGWKLPEEKAERLQILDKMFNLLKDNK